MRSLTGMTFGGSNHEGQDGQCSCDDVFGLGWYFASDSFVCVFGGEGEGVY